MSQNIYVYSGSQLINFGGCIASNLQIENSELVNISFNRSSSIFSISKTRHEKSNFCVPFYHSQNCPFIHLEKLINFPMTFMKKIPILSSVIVKSSDGKVLLTRKSEFMSIHVKSWIFPYEKLKIKETIFKAALKSLREDTGISILEIAEGFLYNNLKVSIRPICIYESVFPKRIEFGMPRNQGLMFFFEANVPLQAKEIQTKCYDVDFIMWIGKEEWENAQAGLVENIQVEGRESELTNKVIEGISPNLIGEGVSEGHFIALNLVLKNSYNI